MKQTALDLNLNLNLKKTHKREFLEKMEQVVPWSSLVELIAPYEILTQCGLLLKTGTVVDASLIAAPISTKNKGKARDPEMHSSKRATIGALA